MPTSAPSFSETGLHTADDSSTAAPVAGGCEMAGAPHTLIARVAQLTDEQLLASTRQLASQELLVSAQLIAHLNEVEARDLHLVHACSTLFSYCVERLGLSEDVAWKRVVVARAARRFPKLLSALATGKLHVTGATLLAPHLSEENHEELISRSLGKSKRDIERLLASWFPRPSIDPSIRKLPDRRADEVSMQPAPGRHNRLEPWSGETYKLQLILSVDVVQKLKQAQALASHRIPPNNLAQVLAEAIDLFLDRERQRRFAASRRLQKLAAKRAPHPRPQNASAQKQDGPPAPLPDSRLGATTTNEHVLGSTLAPCPTERSTSDSAPGRSAGASPGLHTRTRRRKRVPAAVLREIDARDGDRCTYVDVQGNRCTETSFLTLEHKKAHALGGPDTAANLCKLCQKHNQLRATQVFGKRACRHRRNARVSHQLTCVPDTGRVSD